MIFAYCSLALQFSWVGFGGLSSVSQGHVPPSSQRGLSLQRPLQQQCKDVEHHELLYNGLCDEVESLKAVLDFSKRSYSRLLFEKEYSKEDMKRKINDMEYEQLVTQAKVGGKELLGCRTTLTTIYLVMFEFCGVGLLFCGTG
jgi:hypothetical protein